MMNYFYQFVLILFVIFVYLHIRFQFKTANDLEVYEIDYVDNNNLQEVCDIRSPVLFYAPAEISPPNPAKFTKHQNAHDVNIYDIKDAPPSGGGSPPPIKLSFSAASTMISADKNAQFYSASNREFLEESGLNAAYEKNDSIWIPHLTVQKYYDLVLGASGVTLPLTYHVDFRRFIYVARGKITIKMTYWKSEKWLSPRADWDNFEFYSPMNVWNPQPAHEENFEKVEFMDVVVPAGRVIYIPPYFWYSIKFEEDTILNTYSYRSISNIVAIFPLFIARQLSGVWGGAGAGGAAAPVLVEKKESFVVSGGGEAEESCSCAAADEPAPAPAPKYPDSIDILRSD